MPYANPFSAAEALDLWNLTGRSPHEKPGQTPP